MGFTATICTKPHSFGNLCGLSPMGDLLSSLIILYTLNIKKNKAEP